MRIDLHTHSSISDGSDSPSQLVQKAKALGLDVIGLTDHDTFAGLDEAYQQGKKLKLKVLGGVEISTEFEGKSVHLLGYGVDVFNEGLNNELKKIRKSRDQRVEKMVSKLNQLGFEMSVAQVSQKASKADSVGRPHIADAMIEKGYVNSRSEAFDCWLAEGQKAYVGRYLACLPSAIDLIHQAKGVAVIAHPLARGSGEVLTEKIFKWLKEEHELEAIECEHPEHDQYARAELSQIAKATGLLTTGSSDYHGTGKPGLVLGCNTTGEASYLALLKLIRKRSGRIPQ